MKVFYTLQLMYARLPIESIACDLILKLFKIVQVQKNVSCQRITDLAEKKLTYASGLFVIIIVSWFLLENKKQEIVLLLIHLFKSFAI